MIEYKCLTALLTESKELDEIGTLYVRRRQWSENPHNAEIYLLLGDD